MKSLLNIYDLISMTTWYLSFEVNYIEPALTWLFSWNFILYPWLAGLDVYYFTMGIFVAILPTFVIEFVIWIFSTNFLRLSRIKKPEVGLKHTLDDNEKKIWINKNNIKIWLWKNNSKKNNKNSISYFNFNYKYFKTIKKWSFHILSKYEFMIICHWW